MALSAAAFPACAQVNLEAALTTDYRLRGYSLSRREPAASLSVGYDGSSGIFGEVTGVAVYRAGGRLGLMGGYATLGYARRIGDGLSADIGLLRAQYAPDSSFGRATGYTEVFAGISGRSVALRAAFSPDYLWDRTMTLYVSGDVFKRPAEHWRISGHVGALAFVRNGPPAAVSRVRYDWAAQVQREFGRAELGLTLSGGGPEREYFDGSPHTKTAVTATARWAF
ncbi:MAG: hypothetical protein J7485_13480 [Sphingobium sp.]|nr:hypothetical protein [Sphingobium sp.]